MFRRKKDDEAEVKVPAEPVYGDDLDATDDPSAPPMRPFSKRGSHVPNLPQPGAMRAEIPRRTMEVPGVARRPDHQGEGKKLIVGRDIELSGEISACDRLVVEGKVTADLTDAGIIEVSQTGMFRGTAIVDEADISGEFNGSLTVRRKLTIRSTGRVHGAILYARIVIELGGEAHGTIELISGAEGEHPVLHDHIETTAIET